MEYEIKSCAFDLEGTVIDLEGVHHRGHILAARDVGLELTLNQCLEKIPHFIGGPDIKIAEEIAFLGKEDGKDTEPADILKRTKDYYNKLLKECCIEPRRGFSDFLIEVKKMGLKCAVGSLTERVQVTYLLKESDLFDLLDPRCIVTREDVKNPKPAPDVWIETARRVGVEPYQQIVFEDSPRGIEGAVKVGAYCVGMPIYHQPNVVCALLNSGARRIFYQWDELNPQSLVRNINDEIKVR